jgi:uracil-DNA glycosylase
VFVTRLEALLQRAAGQSVSLPSADEVRYTEPVCGEGPMDAKIVILGESLGYEEVKARRNFIGRSGQKLRNHARLAGIHPEKCRIENVYPFYPGGGSIESVDPGVLRVWQENTLERLRQCHEATVIVCIGNVALDTCTGLRDITRRRGSVYGWEGKKVIGMIHPAAILHGKGRGTAQYYEKMCRLDWERVKLLATPHEMHHMYCACATRIERRYIHGLMSTGVTPERWTSGLQWTPGMVLANTFRQYLRLAQRTEQVLAIDIETPRVGGKRQIVCVSFAFRPEESLILRYPEERAWIEALCKSPCVKIGHNFVSFDRWWLEREGIHVGGEIRDTMALHHCLDPASPQSLEFLTSRYTWEPFYKSEAKGHDENVVLASDDAFRQYMEYCGLDSCVTIELHNRLWPELKRRGMLDFYTRHYEALYDPILDVMLRGVEIDHPYRQRVLEDLLTEARECRDKLGEINEAPLWTLNTLRDQAIFDAITRGESLDQWPHKAVNTALERIANKTVSSVQLKKLLYEKLGLEVQWRRRKGSIETPTTDAVALRRLRLDAAHRPDVVEVLDLAMRHNKTQKLATFLYPSSFDPGDGRFRFTLKLNTEAGRLASAAAPDGNGRNSQNDPRDKRIRRAIIPDVGHVLVEADLSQVEGRIVFVRTKDEKLIRLARDRYADQHSYTAHIATGKALELVGKGTEERQAFKSANHAAMRGMMGKTMADTMLKQDIYHTDGTAYMEAECDELLEKYHKAWPGIRIWQQGIRRELRSKKRLVNRWGFVWDVRYEEMNEDLYRRGYNLHPQSENAHLTNFCGFAPLWYWLQGQYTRYWSMQKVYDQSILRRWNHTEVMQSRILLQRHDSLTCSCAPSEAYDVAMFMRDHLEVELDYDGVALSVPTEFSLGMNCGDKVEIGALPEREVFEEKMKEVMGC